MTAVTDKTFEGSPERDMPSTATVAAVLQNDLFRLRLPDGTERTAHVAGDLRKGLTRLLPGDVVRIEIAPLDRTKARIVARLSSHRS
jgi:translation initiation factor IF-1